METLDFVVVGCVAVTRAGGRTGKGGGFADLELGIFRELGKLGADTTVIATTVHSSQVVDDKRLPMMGHDFGAELHRHRDGADRHAHAVLAAGGRRLGPRPARPVREHPLPQGTQVAAGAVGLARSTSQT